MIEQQQKGKYPTDPKKKKLLSDKIAYFIRTKPKWNKAQAVAVALNMLKRGKLTGGDWQKKLKNLRAKGKGKK